MTLSCNYYVISLLLYRLYSTFIIMPWTLVNQWCDIIFSKCRYDTFNLTVSCGHLLKWLENFIANANIWNFHYLLRLSVILLSSEVVSIFRRAQKLILGLSKAVLKCAFRQRNVMNNDWDNCFYVLQAPQKRSVTSFRGLYIAWRALFMRVTVVLTLVSWCRNLVRTGRNISSFVQAISTVHFEISRNGCAW